MAFVIGYFVSNMISGSSLGSGSIVKAVGGKHARARLLWKEGSVHNCHNTQCNDINKNTAYAKSFNELYPAISDMCSNSYGSNPRLYHCGDNMDIPYPTEDECVKNCDEDQFYKSLDSNIYGTYRKDKHNNWIFDHR